MIKKLLFILNLTTLLTLASCSVFNPETPEYENDVRLIILNQGNFTEQNGSISLYSELKDEVTNRAFKQVNGFDIGACIQSGTMDAGGTMYLLCVNPGKVMAVNSVTMECLDEDLLEDNSVLVNPRFINNDGQYLYITVSGSDYEVLPDGMYEYTHSKLLVVSIANGKVVKEIEIGSDAEGIMPIAGKLYVPYRHGVAVLLAAGANTDIIKRIETPTELGAGRHIVYCNNDYLYVSFPEFGIAQIDRYADNVQRTFPMPIDYDGYIVTNGRGDKIYSFCNTYDENYNSTATLNQMDINSGEVKTLLTGTYFYSVGVSPFTGMVYTAETSFSSNSTLKVIGTTGKVVAEHEVGVGTYRYLYLSYAFPVEKE